MLDECLEGLMIKGNGIYIDATFGGGGHSKAILRHLKDGKLIAFDKDRDTVKNIPGDNHFELIRDDFRNIRERLRERSVSHVDGILADLGVSSHQFDTPERGFSFRFSDEELDMRMNDEQELTASYILNNYEEDDLANMLYRYGDFRESRRLAKSICLARQNEPIGKVSDLTRVLDRFIPAKERAQFLARIFQALRIEVNDELAALNELLDQSADLLREGGRLVVISYHSLEDRMVKNFINYGNVHGDDQRDVYGNRIGRKFKPVNKKPVIPSQEEVDRNPRSRSAKLRIAEKIQEPA